MLMMTVNPLVHLPHLACIIYISLVFFFFFFWYIVHNLCVSFVLIVCWKMSLLAVFSFALQDSKGGLGKCMIFWFIFGVYFE